MSATNHAARPCSAAGSEGPKPGKCAALRPLPNAIPVAAICVVVTVLYALIPYNTGYGFKPIPNFHMAWTLWMESEEWKHGILVPPIVAWLVRRLWRDLAALPLKSTATGLPVVLGGLLLYVIGYRADLQYFGYASFQMLLAGLVLWLCGVAHMRLLLFPWAFLFFAWPLPFLDNLVAFPLRMIMATASAALLNIIGVETLQNGTALLSAPNPALGIPAGRVFSLDVANPCSGIRSLFALTMLAALYAHLSQRTLLKQFILFLSAFPLAVIGNMARVTTIAIVAVAIGQNFAAGPYHDFSGYLVFTVAIGLMLALGTILRHGVRNTARAILHPILAWRSHTRSQPHPEPGPTQAY